ncbi:MAG: hypothetical protein L0099_08470 [Acidobacteria bacterium]|nr:hypothetical protein [Acidobacteriota bacterium]
MGRHLGAAIAIVNGGDYYREPVYYEPIQPIINGSGNGETELPAPDFLPTCAPGYIYQGTYPTGRCVPIVKVPEEGIVCAAVYPPPPGCPGYRPPVNGTAPTLPTTPVKTQPVAAPGLLDQELIPGVANKWLLVAVAAYLVLKDTL